MTLSVTAIFLEYICPSVGVIMATSMFAAPITDLRQALLKGSLETLNPFPWAFMTGNCLGWVVYAYYTRDPFVLAANLPGLVSSVWLNSSAAKLQYVERMRHFKPVLPGELQQHQQQQDNLLGHSSSSSDHDLTGRPNLERQPGSNTGSGSSTSAVSNNHWDASPPMDEDEGEEAADLLDHGRTDEREQGYLILVPQERLLLKVLVVWSFVIVFVGWFSTRIRPETSVGIIVNLNLVVFYAAPLESMQTVIRSKRSDSIHTPTMIMNWINTSFWILYGAFVRHDIMILLPNIIGLTLGLLQGLLCVLYPRSSRLEELSEPLAAEAEGLAIAESDPTGLAAADNNDETSDDRFSIA